MLSCSFNLRPHLLWCPLRRFQISLADHDSAATSLALSFSFTVKTALMCYVVGWADYTSAMGAFETTLVATSWKLEEAIQLFYIGNEGGTAASSIYSPPLENDRPLADQSSSQLKEDIGDENGRQADGNEVRAPIPVRRELNIMLYYLLPYLLLAAIFVIVYWTGKKGRGVCAFTGHSKLTVYHARSRVGYSSHEAHSVVPFRNFTEEMKRPGIWESEQGATSTADNAPDNLATLYRPPFALMHNGTFEANPVNIEVLEHLSFNVNPFTNLAFMLSFVADVPNLQAKDAAKIQDKWFLVNVQSNKEFSSHMLNRDTWANEAVSQTISNNFIFWQVYDDTEEGRKVCTYYKLDSIPVILVIDPITGQKMRSWRGMVQPESLLEDLLPFMDGSPKDHHVSLSHKRPRESSQTSPHKIQGITATIVMKLNLDIRYHFLSALYISSSKVVYNVKLKLTSEAPVVADATKEEGEEQLQALAASTEGMKDTSGVASKDQDITNTDKEERPCSPKKPTYPPLPEEAKGDRNLLCRVGVRLPDGRRLQRNFFRTDPIQLLWSFCYAQLPEAQTRPFRLTQAIPGASKFLDYDSKLTFAESGLANSMISVTWEELDEWTGGGRGKGYVKQGVTHSGDYAISDTNCANICQAEGFNDGYCNL
ncbi:hypothetical protein TEA_023691 [Camellia sinensis var. sinensis]|uniref:UBX domain-containing protein n=1 Tax=Camellia sinensis var. sinensis TaxID=542762 RepID=A0A4S4E7H1_CAMSN|nr:hypothetical protein TEA_023691 [Camellia sinensis var. sinensis]